MSKEFKREQKEDRPVLAVCYDFDKTLSPTDMQAQGYIQSIGYDVEKFWKESNKLAEENDMDQNLSYMYKMMIEAEGKLTFTKENLNDYGSRVELFPGVIDWFERLDKYGEENNVIVEHYIISSGLKEMIEGTKISHVFKKIYASSFYFNERNVAKWPAQVINYTNKTQFLFRIEKGILDINDQAVNNYFTPDELRVPFRNMVYIGDSDTDIPCMKLVNTYGGYSIGVYDEAMGKEKVYRMLKDNRIKYFAPANYKENSELDIILKKIITRTSANEEIENIHYQNKNEMEKVTRDGSEDPKDTLILQLSESKTFAYTHTLIEKMSKYNEWTVEQTENLLSIGLQNTQVRTILEDSDLKSFYSNLIEKTRNLNLNNSNVADIKEILRIE